MRVYRIEHNRDHCDSELYRKGGASFTGHGCQSIFRVQCLSAIDLDPVNFGASGNTPRSIMPHERCAATAEQFNYWLSGDSLRISFGWVIAVYELDDNKEGIDWREDNDQIVFNPEFAEFAGNISVEELNTELPYPIEVSGPVKSIPTEMLRKLANVA